MIPSPFPISSLFSFSVLYVFSRVILVCGGDTSVTIAAMMTLMVVLCVGMRIDAAVVVMYCGGVVVDRAVVTTLAGSGTFSFADGSGSNAGFGGPGGVAVDASGNVFVGDISNRRIRKATAFVGMVM